MPNRIIICACVFGIMSVLSTSTGAQQTSAAPRLVIGLDLSVSNPLVEDPAFALKLAERVADEIQDLPVRSTVMIRTFGDNDATANTLQIDEVISARNKPEAVAESVGVLIAQVPSLVESGKLEAQQNTNILGFLQTMVDAIGECQTPTTFILLSDGLEDSEYARLANPSEMLPSVDMRPPRDRRYKCDELQILGLGQGLQKFEDIERLRERWQTWAATGSDRPFKTFVGLSDW